MSLFAKAVVAGKTLTGKGNNTVDPQYIEAEKNLKQIKTDLDQIIGSLTMMESHFGKLSKMVGTFGNDIKTWYMDTPDDDQTFKSQTVSVFSQNFSSLTTNFFVPRFEYNVVKKLSSFQNEIDRLNHVQEMVEESRKQYDKTQTMYDYLIEERDSKVNSNTFLEHLNPLTYIKPNLIELDQEIKDTHDQLVRDKAQYDNFNNDFITSVNKLAETRDKTIDGSFKSFICILSQYIMRVFKDMQKFKTSFPPECFIPKTEKQQESFFARKQNSNNNDNSNE
ncbi:hypothetical protein M9Y10_001888 [Tritrichomonas musculus]|uniref:BAR domain-containing protein n=1 Tax=Tritrichomonas musculus TaxID=1915356 RepID=A0ABR2L891_9EUKA